MGIFLSGIIQQEGAMDSENSDSDSVVRNTNIYKLFTAMFYQSSSGRSKRGKKKQKKVNHTNCI